MIINTGVSLKSKISKRKSISYSDKVRNLIEIHKGVKKKDVAQLFKILASTLSVILKIDKEEKTANKISVPGKKEYR